jgi:exopolysaccharide biosynthesis polyprenyl glycosylphosphotransferase
VKEKQPRGIFAGAGDRLDVEEAIPDLVMGSDRELSAVLTGVAERDVIDTTVAGRRKSAGLVILRILVDVGALEAAALLSYWLRFRSAFVLERWQPAHIPSFQQLIIPLLAGLPLLLLFLRMSGMYQTHIRIRTLDRVPRVVAAVNAYVISLLVVMFVLKAQDPPRGYLILFWFLCFTFIFFGRSVLQVILSFAGVSDIVERKTLIVGAGKVGKALALKLKHHPEFGLQPIGFIDNEPLYESFNEPELRKLSVLGGTADFADIVKEQQVEKVIIGFSRDSHEELLELVSECNELGVDCSILPRLFEVITDELIVREVGGISMVPLRQKRVSGFDMVLKDIEDYTLAALGLLLFWPLLLATAIAIKIDSPGPVFFMQERVGKNGKHFNFVKFRSMVINAEELRDHLDNENDEDDILWKIQEDPRITRVGKWIRKFSLDEAPQIFNVLAGHMSIVGPRPGLPEEVARYKGWQRLRLNIKPGITGMWQVSGRSELPFDEMVKYDLYYIERWSLWLDLKTMMRTVTAVLSRKGAY